MGRTHWKMLAAMAVVLVLNALIAGFTRWRGAHAEGVVLTGVAT